MSPVGGRVGSTRNCGASSQWQCARRRLLQGVEAQVRHIVLPSPGAPPTPQPPRILLAALNSQTLTGDRFANLKQSPKMKLASVSVFPGVITAFPAPKALPQQPLRIHTFGSHRRAAVALLTFN